MSLKLNHLEFIGPALPAPFVQFELEKALLRRGLLVPDAGPEGKALQEKWEIYRRKLRSLVNQGGSVRVFNHVLEPLVLLLGYTSLARAAEVQTREGMEDGGYLFSSSSSDSQLRVWSTDFDLDLEAPSRRGYAYRYSPVRIAQRVLLAGGERLGLLTNGTELRLLISDPARPDSQVMIPLVLEWKKSRLVPDSFRLLLSLASPAGVNAIPEIVEQARLMQTKVTADLRLQARQAIERFIQDVLDNPDNSEFLKAHEDKSKLAKALWREGLVIVYRLLFIFKLESTDDLAQAFSFASSSLWRGTYSPSTALASITRAILDEGAYTGQFLEQGIRTVFSIFATGLTSTELNILPLGGVLFGSDTTPILSSLTWGEKACASLLDCLLWTPRKKGSASREKVHYGPLYVEDLGRVYEALLELEAGIATEPMCRLRRQKLEVVVPIAQGEKYRPAHAQALQEKKDLILLDEEPEEEVEEDAPKGKKTKVEWIEEIPRGHFYLRVGLGRKATGSYYTPHSFVRFLVQETLGAKVAEMSPQDDPRPNAILSLKVLDPAMGSGHFLVEACRFLGEALYEACRLCDDLAMECEARAENETDVDEKAEAFRKAEMWRQRVVEIPDPDDELVQYLPSRAPEGAESGLSEAKANALCRRLVAVHCLYGVDKNPLAVELAKLSLWLVSHAEGLPLTFLDHRLVVGDSLTGPFFEHLLKYPEAQEPLDNLFSQGLEQRLTDTLAESLKYVSCLESSIGVSIPETEAKEEIKNRLDMALFPFRILAAAWAGGVMLGPGSCDNNAYRKLATEIGRSGKLPDQLDSKALRYMIAKGLGVQNIPELSSELQTKTIKEEIKPAFPYDLIFPEVFYPYGFNKQRNGFDVVLGNPPWDAIQFKSKEFFAAFDFEIMNAPTKRERTAIEKKLLADSEFNSLFETYKEQFEELKRANDSLYIYQKVYIEGDLAGRQIDAFRVFMERNAQLLEPNGWTGVVVPSAFHANEGATGVRRLYLKNMAMRCCYSFENKKKLFEIHSSFKYALVVADKSGYSDIVSCAFYLQDDSWLFNNDFQHPRLIYSIDFIENTGGDYLTLLELRNERDLEIAKRCFSMSRNSFGAHCKSNKIVFGREFDMTRDSWCFSPSSEVVVNNNDPRNPDVASRLLKQGYMVLNEGKTFWHYDDSWQEIPSYCIGLDKIHNRINIMKPACYFRLAYRRIASSTNERTIIFCLFPCGTLFAESAPVERNPYLVKRKEVLKLLAVANTFTFDWTARIRTGANINQFILYSCPFPTITKVGTFLTHSALRLTCNHWGYKPLWHEQLSDAWREPTPSFTWPVLESDDDRWTVRAAIDAVVADTYGLNREQYSHILSSFSHKSYPAAPSICLSMFDELKHIGLESFTQKYDPYWDIPLNENLPQPVMSLPDLNARASLEAAEGPGTYQISLFGEEHEAETKGISNNKRRRKSRVRRLV